MRFDRNPTLKKKEKENPGILDDTSRLGQPNIIDHPT